MEVEGERAKEQYSENRSRGLEDQAKKHRGGRLREPGTSGRGGHVGEALIDDGEGDEPWEARRAVEVAQDDEDAQEGAVVEDVGAGHRHKTAPSCGFEVSEALNGATGSCKEPVDRPGGSLALEPSPARDACVDPIDARDGALGPDGAKGEKPAPEHGNAEAKDEGQVVVELELGAQACNEEDQGQTEEDEKGRDGLPKGDHHRSVPGHALFAHDVDGRGLAQRRARAEPGEEVVGHHGVPARLPSQRLSHSVAHDAKPQRLDSEQQQGQTEEKRQPSGAQGRETGEDPGVETGAVERPGHACGTERDKEQGEQDQLDDSGCGRAGHQGCSGKRLRGTIHVGKKQGEGWSRAFGVL